MCKKNLHCQLRFMDFQQLIGLKMNPENRWIQKADAKSWAKIESFFSQPNRIYQIDSIII